MGTAIGLLLALLLPAPERPINLDLPPPPPLAPQAPPAPAWSNFQIDVPRPASRLAWLPAYFHSPPKPPGYDAQPYRGSMIGHTRSSCSGRRR